MGFFADGLLEYAHGRFEARFRRAARGSMLGRSVAAVPWHPLRELIAMGGYMLGGHRRIGSTVTPAGGPCRFASLLV